MAIRTLQPGGKDLTTIGATAGDSVQSIYGGQTVNNADLTSLTTTGIVDLMLGPQTSIKWDPSNPLKAKITGKLVLAGTNEQCYFQAHDGTNPSTFARVKVLGKVDAYPTGGTMTLYEQRDGATFANTSVIMPKVACCGGMFNAQFITGTSGYQLAVFSGGIISTERGLDTDQASPRMIICGGAQVTVARSTVVDATIASPGTTNLPMGTGSAASGLIGVYGAGSYLNWQGYTIDTLEVFGGAAVDFTACPVSLSVGTLRVDVKSLMASKWQSKVPGVTITYSSKEIYAANDDTLPG